MSSLATEWTDTYASMLKHLETDTIKPMSTMSGCAAMTLSYGCLVKINRRKDKKISTYEIRELLDTVEWGLEKPLHVEFLRCCWPGETGIDLFIGFSVIPFYWSVKGDGSRRKLETFTTRDDNLSFRSVDPTNPNTINTPENYYDISDEIHWRYVNVPTWKDSLIVSNYDCMDNHVEPLNNMFSDYIDKVNQLDIVNIFKNELEKIDEVKRNVDFDQPQWVFIPSDCASCT